MAEQQITYSSDKATAYRQLAEETESWQRFAAAVGRVLAAT